MKKTIIVLLVIFLLAFFACTNENTPKNRFDFSLIHDNLERNYVVYVPENAPDINLPVVVYFHGGGGSTNAAFVDKMDEKADELGFILVAPEGTGKRILGKLFASWNGGIWETGACCGEADDIGFISKMLEEVKKDFLVDSKRIYATGISNGGLMTNRVGCELSEEFAAIATVAPAAVPTNCAPTRDMPIMDIHGKQDPCNPFNGGDPTTSFCKDVEYTRMTPNQVVDKWVEINNCTSSQETFFENSNVNCVSNYDCAFDSEVVFCTVDNMGHTWPSGSQYLSENLVGPVSYDISFNQVWDFFQKHSLE